jgi:hypothetical protein
MASDKDNLENLLDITQEAVDVILNDEKVIIGWSDIFLELQSIDKTEDLKEIARKYYSVSDIVDKLVSSGVLTKYVKVLDVIRLDVGIVPEDVPQAIDEEIVKFSGEIWTIHKSDIDPFPSNPHAHNYQKRLKMHLGTGELFSGSIKVGKINRKNFIAFRDRIQHIALPVLEI